MTNEKKHARKIRVKAKLLKRKQRIRAEKKVEYQSGLVAKKLKKFTHPTPKLLPVWREIELQKSNDVVEHRLLNNVNSEDG